MEPEAKEPPWMMGPAGVMSLVLGFIKFAAARTADRNGSVIFYRASWLSPAQGYVAAGLCIAFGAVLVVFWLSRRHSK
jgi:hypothetical protein